MLLDRRVEMGLGLPPDLLTSGIGQAPYEGRAEMVQVVFDPCVLSARRLLFGAEDVGPAKRVEHPEVLL